MISNKLYDVLKWVGLIALPGLAWFIGDVGPAWGMANVDAIVLTLSRAGTLLGIMIGISTAQYNKEF